MESPDHGNRPLLARVLTVLRTRGVAGLLAATADNLAATARLHFRRGERAFRRLLGLQPQLRVLVIDDRIPARDLGSGYGRSLTLLEHLTGLANQVTLAPMSQDAVSSKDFQALERLDVKLAPSQHGFWRFARDRAGEFDIVLVSRPHNFSKVVPILRRYLPTSYTIYDAEALYFSREQLRASVCGEPTDRSRLETMLRTEVGLLRMADHVLVVSDHERAMATSLAPDLAGRIKVWGYPTACMPTPAPFHARCDVLFIGAFPGAGSPNEDAVLHFLDAIWPRVASELGCRFRVVGSAPENIRRRASSVVDIVGFAPDLASYYDMARVFVVPHRYSAGISIKLLDAMSRGVPAVVSELTAIQLGLKDGVEVLVARSVEDFALKLVELYTNPDRWVAVREAALHFVSHTCDPDRLHQTLASVLAGAATHLG